MTDQPTSPPEAFFRWQIESRRAMLDGVAAGGHPRRFAAHLPVMVTFGGDDAFPIHTATKGAGLTPRDGVLDSYVSLLEDALARCAGRPWVETPPNRVAAVRALLDRPEDVDMGRLGLLEIFQVLARRIFEGAPFHLRQPGYAAAYSVWVDAVLNKTPPLPGPPRGPARLRGFRRRWARTARRWSVGIPSPPALSH